MPSIRFRMREAFEPGDPLGTWILGLAGMLNDLILVNVRANDAWETSGTEPSPEGIYFFRLAASHYREAAKFQAKWDQVSDVAAFIARLRPDHLQDYEAFHASYEPWDNSFVKTVLRPIRNHLFHYFQPHDMEEAAAALVALGDVETTYRLEGGQFRGLRALFADDLASQMTFGHIGEFSEVTEAIARLAALMLRLIRFAEAAVTTYFYARGLVVV